MIRMESSSWFHIYFTISVMTVVVKRSVFITAQEPPTIVCIMASKRLICLLLGLVITLLILTSCGKKPYEVVDINSALAKTSEVAEEDLSSILGEDPTVLLQLAVTPSAYVGFRLPSTDTVLYDIRDKTGKICLRFARKGNGPGEYLSPMLLDLQEEDGELSFSLLDLDRFRQDDYRFKLAENLLLRTDSRDIPNELRPIGQLLQTDRGYWGIMDGRGTEYYTTDEGFGQIAWHVCQDIPEMTFQEEQRFHSASCVSPDGKRVVIAYLNLPRIDILSSDGQTLKVCYFGKRMEVEDASLEERFFGYVNCDDEFIYVIWRGTEGKNLVLQLTWDCQITKVVDVHRSLVSFTPFDGDLYALAFSQEDGNNSFVRYKF